MSLTGKRASSKSFTGSNDQEPRFQAQACKTGMDIPGIGKANVDHDNKIISVDRMLVLNKDTLAELLKLGI